MRTYKRYRASVKVRLGICTCIYASNHGLAFRCVDVYMFYHVYPCDVSWRVILSEPGSIDILLRDYVLLAFYSIYLYVYRVLTSYVLDVHSHVWHMGLAGPQVVNNILLTNLLTYLLKCQIIIIIIIIMIIKKKKWPISAIWNHYLQCRSTTCKTLSSHR